MVVIDWFSKARLRVDPILFPALVIVWANRFFTELAFSNLVTSPDSPDYLAKHFLDFGNVSVVGNAIRPWPTTLLYALVPDQLIVLVQLVLSGIATTLFILTVIKFANSRAAKLVISLGSAICLSYTSRLGWDTLANAESLSNTLAVLMVVYLIRVLQSPSNRASLALFVIFGFLYSNQRLLNVVIFLCYALIILIRIHGRRRTGVIVISLALVALTAYTANNQNKAWPSTYVGFALTGHLNTVSPISSAFSASLSTANAPKCILDLKLRALDRQDPLYCPEGETWVRDHMKGAFVHFLINNPTSIVPLLKYGIFGAFSDSSTKIGNGFSVLPQTVDTIFVGERNPKEGVFFQKAPDTRYYMYVPSFFLLLLTLIFMISARSRSGKRTNSEFSFWTGVMTATILVNSLVLFLTSLLTSAEWTRILEPYSLIIDLVAFVLLVVSCEITLERSEHPQN